MVVRRGDRISGILERNVGRDAIFSTTRVGVFLE
jgi:hypothetical protein